MKTILTCAAVVVGVASYAAIVAGTIALLLETAQEDTALIFVAALTFSGHVFFLYALFAGWRDERAWREAMRSDVHRERH